MVIPRQIAAFSLLLGCSPLIAAAQGMPGPDSASAGRALALRICTPCHVVAHDQPSRPTLHQRTPSFKEIAKKPGTTAESLRNFLLTTHSTMSGPMRMPNPMLDDDQVAVIVSYILSLQEPERGRR